MTPAGLILTPGASADRDHPTLIALDDGLPELAVRRLTLGTTSIPRAVGKIVEASNDLAEELGVTSAQIALGGRSFGGRACSVTVAEGQPAAVLLLLSYPLHPPGKPEKLRVEHLSQIEAPTLFLSGRSDPFGSPAEFEQHLGSMIAPVTHELVTGGHAPKDNDAIVAVVRSFLGL